MPAYLSSYLPGRPQDIYRPNETVHSHVPFHDTTINPCVACAFYDIDKFLPSVYVLCLTFYP